MYHLRRYLAFQVKLLVIHSKHTRLLLAYDNHFFYRWQTAVYYTTLLITSKIFCLFALTEAYQGHINYIYICNWFSGMIRFLLQLLFTYVTST